MSVVVTQADRQAAAAFSEQVVGRTNGHDHIAECRNGQRDETYIVQAFARHRTEATEELLEALAPFSRMFWVGELPDDHEFDGGYTVGDLRRVRAAIARATGAA